MIKVIHLQKKFDTRGIAGLQDVSFTLKKGEVMGLMGPNGSGKTTLLKILAGQLAHDAGSLLIDGEVRLFPAENTDETINVQEFLVAKVRLEIEDQKKIQLARDLADTFEFTFQLRQKISELSSGQKQKVLLAGELIDRPALLLMDEPFAHLDPFTRRDILDGLFRYIQNQDMTVLWVTHELDEALRYSSVLGVMHFGKIQQLDTPTALVQRPRDLFVAQFMGYQNFFPVKETNGTWHTPWGTWKHTSSFKNEAILVIPDEAWSWENESGLEVKIKSSYPVKQGMEYHFEFQERLFILRTNLSTLLPDHGHPVSLAPRWERCFLISL